MEEELYTNSERRRRIEGRGQDCFKHIIPALE